MGERLILSKLVAGQVHVVGELNVAANGEGKLAVKAPGAEADALRAAWREVSAMPVIRMKWSETDPADKSGQTQLLLGRDVAKGEPEYVRAVADILSRQFGYFASPADIG